MAWDNEFRILVFILIFFRTGALSQSVDMTVDKMMPVTEGDRVGFTCKISGDPRTVSYARSGGELITSWITIAGRCDKLQAPDTTLYTASCDRDNSMFYMTILNVTSSFHHINITCEAQYGTDSADTVDGFIFMEVNVPLKQVDISENGNITVQEAYYVNVSCTARSRPLPYFTWYISERQIDVNYTTITYNDIIVSSTVSYRGNRSDNNHMLYCRVDNGFTELSSSVIFLNITYPPDIYVFPNGVPVEGIQQYNLTCLVLDSNPTENSFSWHIGSDLSTGIQQSSVLTLPMLSRLDSNNYTCSATNGVGDVTSETVFIDVLYKGSILQFNSSNSFLSDGDMFLADVQLEGKPLPNVTWSYNRTGSILLTENGVTNSSLNITTRCQDTGNYSCSVDNGLVQPDTADFRITVTCKPRTEQNANDQNDFSIQDGSALSLQTTFISYPQPNITWYFRTDNLSSNSTVLTNGYDITSDEAIHITTLSIASVNSSHNGQYVVMAKNSLGEDMRVFTVNIVEPSESKGVKTEAIVGGVVGAIVFIVIVGLVINCYRKKKRKEKERNRSWRSSSRDIDDIIKENVVDEPIVEPIEPMYTTSPGYYHSSSHTTKVEVSVQGSDVYSNVSKLSVKQSNGLTTADADANTKF